MDNTSVATLVRYYFKKGKWHVTSDKRAVPAKVWFPRPAITAPPPSSPVAGRPARPTSVPTSPNTGPSSAACSSVASA